MDSTGNGTRTGTGLEWADDLLGGAIPGDQGTATEWLTGADDGTSPGPVDEGAAEWLVDDPYPAPVADDEAEFLPALAAIIPAVISAAPAIISAVQQLTSKPAPRPAPTPAPPAPVPAPVTAAPRPVPAPAPMRTIMPVPGPAPVLIRPAPAPTPAPAPPPAPAPAPMPSRAAAPPASGGTDVLQQLAALLPRLVELVGGRPRESSAPQTARESAGESQEGEPEPSRTTGRGPPAPGEPVPLPDRTAVNVGISPCPTSLLVSRFGRPRDLVTDQCQALTSAGWESRMTSGQVGTFRVRGHRRAVALFAEAFAALADADPDLHARVGTTGMLCVRHVRGRPDTLSNHALGLALDVTLDGRSPIRGDALVDPALLTLHEVLGPFGIFWGAGLRPEDALHFEVGAEVVHRWLDDGSF